MRTPARLAAFGAILAASFAAAWGVGAAIDPIATPSDTGSSGGHGHGEEADIAVTGLAVAADGLRLVPESTTLSVDAPSPFRFRIERTDDGSTVTEFDVTHERELHLIVADAGLGSFQHVHPERDAGGTWTIDLAVPAPGAYRVYAELRPAGAEESTVLSTVASAPGWAAAPVPHAPERTASVDGYELRLDGDLAVGTTSEVAITVTLDGEPVTDLEPYLGASGHLVSLREGDLAYAHVHPVEDAGSGPTIRFGVEVPAPGTYRMFLDFSHGGVVRTAAFTVEVPPAGAAPFTDDDGHDSEGHG